MEVITIDSEAYKQLLEKIDLITDYITEKENSNSAEKDELWVDSYEVCTYLRISERTLQRLRANGLIRYSVILGRNYYTIDEVKRMLNARLIKSDGDNLEELIRQHQNYQKNRKLHKLKK